MPGEKETTVGSSAHLAASTSKTTLVPSTTTTTCQTNSLPTAGLKKVAPAPATRPIAHHHACDGGEGETDEEEDGSKMELELTFAGIDNDTVELELEEDEANVDSNGTKGPSPLVAGPESPVGARGPTVGGAAAEAVDEDEDEEDVEGGKTVECTEVIVPIQTLAEKCLFYVTAFFILLAVFSLFAFLFLVPFVIDPAFTTIFMEFDPEPAFCLTVSNVALEGLSNCNWTSCREGCTREIFSCKQIRVNYRHAKGPYPGGGDLPPGSSSSSSSSSPWATNTAAAGSSSSNNVKSKNHYQQNSNHLTNSNTNNKYAAYDPGRSGGSSYSNKKRKHKLTPASSELTRRGSDGWDYVGAHLFPNVKGCGYPPVTVCSDFYDKYGKEGTNFSCYYSKVDRGLVVTKYDMSRVILDLVYSMAIPIPSFIISVVYLIFAYFRLYNSDSSSSAHRRASTLNVNQSSTNNNIQAGTAGGSMGDPDGDTSLSVDEKTQIIHKSTSRGLNAVDKLVPNSGKGIHSQVIEMNDLKVHNPADGDLLLPRRNNRAPERNGPANPAAKNKGEMNGQNGSHHNRTETEKYLEPGVLPEKNTVLPPIELPPPTSTKKSCKQMTMTLT